MRRVLRTGYGQGLGPGTRCAVFVICKHRDQEAAASGNNGVQVGNRFPSFIGVPGMARIPGENIWLSVRGGIFFDMRVRRSRTALCAESFEQSGVRLSFLWGSVIQSACTDRQIE